MSRIVPWLVGAAAGALYLALPSLRHNFDGVACAIAVELGDLRHLVHGNHLAYGLVGLAFWRLLAAAGLRLPALWALKLMDSLCGALGAGLFARHLQRRGRGPTVAAAGALGLSVSWGWWLHSIDAQVYLLAAPLLVLLLDEAVSDRPRPMRLAFLHTGAMLAHVSHALLAPAVVWSLWHGEPRGEERRRAVGRYLAFCFLAVVTAYAAALSLCVKPASWDAARLWLLGSAALGPYRAVHWLAPPSLASGLASWAGSALHVVCYYPLLGAGLWAAAAWGWAGPRAGRERAVAALWLCAYPLLLLTYEPWNVDYRIMDLLPLWALAAAAVPEGAAGRAALAAYALAVGSANAAWGILPRTRAETNLSLMKTRWLGRVLPDDAWVTAFSIEEVYIPYFDHLRTLNLRWYEGRTDSLRGRIEGLLEAGEPVYATSDYADGAWAEAFAPFPRDTVSTWDGVRLYRLGKMNGNPKGSR